jgi:hypothetical protein
MPSEKEIEEAIDWIKNEEFGAVGNSHTYTLIDAYLSMKSERDKYKAIVEADTPALTDAMYYIARMDCVDCTYWEIERALALREKES